MSFQNNKLKKLIIAAMFGAIICVVTMVVKIPLPLGGYVHLGDAFIILAGLYLGWVYGGTAAGIGSMLADVFTGYVIHPHSMSLDNRKRCLILLKKSDIRSDQVLMPNLTPISVRKLYSLYENKICTDEEAAQCRGCLEQRVKLAGNRIVTSIGNRVKETE